MPKFFQGYPVFRTGKLNFYIFPLYGLCGIVRVVYGQKFPSLSKSNLPYKNPDGRTRKQKRIQCPSNGITRVEYGKSNLDNNYFVFSLLTLLPLLWISRPHFQKEIVLSLLILQEVARSRGRILLLLCLLPLSCDGRFIYYLGRKDISIWELGVATSDVNLFRNELSQALSFNLKKLLPLNTRPLCLFASPSSTFPFFGYLVTKLLFQFHF